MEKNKIHTQEWLDTVYHNYQKKIGQLPHDEIDHIIEWLNSPSAEKYQNKIYRISVDSAKDHAKKWTEKLIKKSEKLQKIEENNDGTKTVFNWPDGYKIVELESEASYGKEGAQMGHCVYSYYGREEAVIFSLRDKNNNPHCTIEYIPQDKHINQIKGKENKGVSAKYQKYVLDFLNSYELLNFESYYQNDLENIKANAFGSYLFTSMPEEVLYPKDLTAKNGRFPYIFKTLIVEGDLTIENIHQARKIAETLIVKGDLSLRNIPSLLRLADNIVVEGDIEIENCPVLKRLGLQEVFKGDIYIEECPQYNKMPKTKGEVELCDVPLLEE